jgi:hypothetical protein
LIERIGDPSSIPSLRFLRGFYGYSATSTLDGAFRQAPRGHQANTFRSGKDGKSDAGGVVAMGFKDMPRSLCKSGPNSIDL